MPFALMEKKFNRYELWGIWYFNLKHIKQIAVYNIIDFSVFSKITVTVRRNGFEMENYCI